mmetsp:Transcript_20754/g.28562  ORF Transcript_20754/g.28562 Transcript_20754/m.28562 type:complete len:196 (-) Transcript_20754:46-633(-)
MFNDGEEKMVTKLWGEQTAEYITLINTISKDFDTFYSKSTSNLIEIKTLARYIHLKVEERKKISDQKRNIVDLLQLSLENLQYKEAFLRREIKACRDLATPCLNEIEKELNMQLGTTIYHEDIEATNDNTMALLRKEKEDRKLDMNRLEELNNESKKKLDQLDKKRKFLDELPTKIDQLKAATTDLRQHFTTIVD